MNRKDRIAQHLRENTERFVAGGLVRPNGLETADIARALHLDRANVSKLLNELWNAGQAVKVQGRPTLYLSARALEQALPGQFIPSIIAQIEDLRALYQDTGSPVELPEKQDEPSVLQDSLRALVQEALSVCSYPPYGLPLVLVSPSQEDSEAVVHRIFEQLKSRRPAGAKLVTIDCRGSLQGGDGFLQRLFGCSRESSLGDHAIRSSFELSAHGMVLLDGVHRLPEPVLEQLLTIIDRRTYCRIGETTSRALDTTLVLTLPPQNNEQLLTRLNKHIPCIQTLPSLDSRSMGERLELLARVLGQEAFALGKPLRLGKDALAYLLCAQYPAGISEMKGVVRLLCSAVLQTPSPDREEYLSVECHHLPQPIISYAEGHLDRLHRVRYLLSLVPNDYLFFSPGGHSEVLQSLRGAWLRVGALDALPDDDIFSPGPDRLAQPEQYIRDLQAYLRGCGEAKLAQMQKAIPFYIFQTAGRRLSQAAGGPVTEVPLQIGLLLPMLTLSLRGEHWQLPQGALPAPNEQDAALCRELFALFSPPEGLCLSADEEAFFSAYLDAARSTDQAQQTALLILCHGKTIASEYAGLVRRYGPPDLPVGAVDVPEGETLAAVTEWAAQLTKVLHRGGGVALVADMPSLLSLAPEISQQAGVPCRAVGEVSLSLLLHLAQQCAAGRSLAELTPADRVGELQIASAGQYDEFMRRYLWEVFARNLTFLDLSKAVGTLSPALTGILEDLKILYSHEVAVKFLSHSSYMLERVIAGHAMNFPNLRRFLAENREVVAAVQRRFEPVANTFGITVPAAEIAYIAEIFLEYR